MRSFTVDELCSRSHNGSETNEGQSLTFTGRYNACLKNPRRSTEEHLQNTDFRFQEMHMSKACLASGQVPCAVLVLYYQNDYSFADKVKRAQHNTACFPELFWNVLLSDRERLSLCSYCCSQTFLPVAIMATHYIGIIAGESDPCAAHTTTKGLRLGHLKQGEGVSLLVCVSMYAQ